MRSCSATSGVVAAAATTGAAEVDAPATFDGVPPRVLVVRASGVEARDSVEAEGVGPAVDGKMHSISHLYTHAHTHTRRETVSRAEVRRKVLYFEPSHPPRTGPVTHVLQR